MAEFKPNDNCLLVYLDETGHEELKDLQYPVYGMGGCAVLAKVAYRLLDEPWLRMKDEHLGGRNVPFHASSTLRSATADQRTALCGFFKDAVISRFATVMHINTVLPPTVKPYHLMSAVIFNMVAKVCFPYPLDSMALIFESSERGNPLIQQAAANYRFGDEHGNKIPTEFFFMDKTRMDPGLEVADCIANTAGRHAKHRLKTGKAQPNDLFTAVFQSVPKPLSHYIMCDSALMTEAVQQRTGT